MRKHLRWGNKKERKTHLYRPLHVTRERAMAAADSYSPSQLRACELHHGRNNNLIEKGCGEKTLGKIKMRGKLTAVAFCRRVSGGDSGGRPLLPLLTDGGRLAWLE
mgnify:CR=1 FL=1